MFREKSDSPLVEVIPTLPEKDEERVNYLAFVPAIHNDCQALLFKMPYAKIKSAGWALESDEGLLSIYRTLAELLGRSIKRVLRLSKRKSSFEIIVDQLRSPGDHPGETKERETQLLFLDQEEGGSGIIHLIWEYWDAIVEEASRLTMQSCCEKGCYQCILSYDNQFHHKLLNKSLFQVEGDTPIFKAIRKLNQEKGAIDLEASDGARNRETDPRSPAEKNFETYLAQKGVSRTTQTEREDLRGQTITVTDFKLQSPSGSSIDIFIDGAAYHGNPVKFLSDIEKRNSLTKQACPWAALPALLVAPAVDEQTVGYLLDRWMNPSRKLSPIEVGMELQLPVLKLEPETLRRLNPEFLGARPFQMLDGNETREAALAFWKEKISDRFFKAIEALNSSFYPIGARDNELLWSINPAKVFPTEDEIRLWEALTLLQALWTAEGYLPLNAWRGVRPGPT